MYQTCSGHAGQILLISSARKSAIMGFVKITYSELLNTPKGIMWIKQYTKTFLNYEQIFDTTCYVCTELCLSYVFGHNICKNKSDILFNLESFPMFINVFQFCIDFYARFFFFLSVTCRVDFMPCLLLYLSQKLRSLLITNVTNLKHLPIGLSELD